MEKIKIIPEIVAAFETWHNGGPEASNLFLRSEDGYRLDEIIERNRGSFAALHTFTSEEDAVEAYNKVIDEIMTYQKERVGFY